MKAADRGPIASGAGDRYPSALCGTCGLQCLPPHEWPGPIGSSGRLDWAGKAQAAPAALASTPLAWRRRPVKPASRSRCITPLVWSRPALAPGAPT